MPQSKTTADTPSGILEFEGEWNTGGFDQDPFTSKYDQSTFAFTKANNSRVSFSFTGYEVAIYGAYRINHGRYQVYFDNTPKGPYRIAPNAPISEDAQEFKESLFHWFGEQGKHTVTLENLPYPNQTNSADNTIPLTFVDIDYVEWSSSAENLEDVKIQEGDGRFAYLDSSWNEKDDGNFDSGTGHVSSQNGASVNITFAGDRICLYGLRGPSQASYTVQIDDQASIVYNGTILPNAKPAGKQLLHSSFGLDPARNHSLVVTSMQGRPGDQLSIDYMMVDGIANKVAAASSGSGGNSGGSNGNSSTASTDHRTLAGGTIAGIVLGIIAFLVFAAALVLFCLRRRQEARVDPFPGTQMQSYRSRMGMGGNASSSSVTPFTASGSAPSSSHGHSTYPYSHHMTPHPDTIPAVPPITIPYSPEETGMGAYPNPNNTTLSPIRYEPGSPSDVMQPPLYNTIIQPAAHPAGRGGDYASGSGEKRRFDRALRVVSR